MNSQALANSAWACGLLGYSSAQLPGVWLQQGVRLLQQGQQHSFGTQDCSNLCWAAVVLDLRRHVPDVLQLAAACSPLWDSMEAEDLQQLYQAHLWLLDCQLPSAGQGLAGCLTRQQLQQCQHSWEQVLATKTAQPSQLQRSVFAALQRLPGSTWQQAPAMEQRTPDGAYSIDIAAVTAAGGLQLAVEVDGPSHFLRQPRRAVDGPTRCRNRALAVRGFSVVSMPYWEWRELTAGGEGDRQQQQQQQRYLLDKSRCCWRPTGRVCGGTAAASSAAPPHAGSSNVTAASGGNGTPPAPPPVVGRVRRVRRRPSGGVAAVEA
jgi:hypothetical protein